MERPLLTKSFLIFLIISVLIACYLVFKPFLTVILIATILVSIFYTPYEQLVRLLRGKQAIASLLMCLLVAVVIILPVTNFIVYAAQRSVVAYDATLSYIETKNIQEVIEEKYWTKFNVLGLGSDTVKSSALEIAKKANDWLMSGAGNLLKGTTNFVISFVLILFTMFFFFIDGKKMMERLMYLTPLPNKYDKEIFKKFRNVSSSTMVSTFVTAIAQGLVGAIGLMIVGVPAFFAGIAMGFLSLLPYFGAGLVWFPTAIYLLIVGKIWQGIFLIIWGVAVVGVIDNLIRAYIIKGKAQVHPLFIIFSILGGIALFGFWGVIFGPLVISLAVTILHIYELEYEHILDRKS